MRDGTQLPTQATLNAELVSSRKAATWDGGSVQVTLYRLPEGGHAVQTVHRLPAGCCRHEAPVYFRAVETARQAQSYALS